MKTGGEHPASSQGVLGGARGLKKQEKILPPRVFQRARLCRHLGLGLSCFSALVHTLLRLPAELTVSFLH